MPVYVLDDAAEWLVLCMAGGGYRVIHPRLQDYCAPRDTASGYGRHEEASREEDIC
jgi:hypothetical protein